MFFKSFAKKRYIVILILLGMFAGLGAGAFLYLKPIANLNKSSKKTLDTNLTKYVGKSLKISSDDKKVTGLVYLFEDNGSLVADYALMLKDNLLNNGKCIDGVGTACKDNTNNIVKSESIQYRYIADFTQANLDKSVFSIRIEPMYCNQDQYTQNPSSYANLDITCGKGGVDNWQPIDTFFLSNRIYLSSYDDLIKAVTLNVYDSSRSYEIITKTGDDGTLYVGEQGGAYADSIKPDNKVKTYTLSYAE